MFAEIYSKINKRVEKFVIDTITKEHLHSVTKREKRLTSTDIKEQMYFEVDVKKLADLQTKLDELEDEEGVFDTFKYPPDLYPEKYI